MNPLIFSGKLQAIVAFDADNIHPSPKPKNIIEIIQMMKNTVELNLTANPNMGRKTTYIAIPIINVVL